MLNNTEKQNTFQEENIGASEQPGWYKITVNFSDPDPYDEIEIRKIRKYAERGKFRGV